MPISAVSLENAIKNALPVVHLEIQDESDGCGDKFSVVIVSEIFEGKNTLQRHRLVNELLKDYIARIHAFSQKTLTPQQYREQLAK
ncbi:bola-like protein [Coprinellus micaceus]|uniref:Bola-like protein n=1 Tax=Coprinellus micaceus TaxID=71717 RepID=A0A4Y7STG3_COPMI|nr:bola-like protein [Coprinellus micaceus]